MPKVNDPLAGLATYDFCEVHEAYHAIDGEFIDPKKCNWTKLAPIPAVRKTMVEWLRGYSQPKGDWYEACQHLADTLERG